MGIESTYLHKIPNNLLTYIIQINIILLLLWSSNHLSLMLINASTKILKKICFLLGRFSEKNNSLSRKAEGEARAGKRSLSLWTFLALKGLKLYTEKNHQKRHVFKTIYLIRTNFSEHKIWRFWRFWRFWPEIAIFSARQIYFFPRIAKLNARQI